MIDIVVRHDFPGFRLDVALHLPDGGATVLFGPSGCGKTTIIAAMAGLLRPDGGQIVLSGTTLFDRTVFIPPERRRMGVVFQDARLFPHLNVAENLRYGQRRAPPGPIGFDQVVALLDIAHLLARRPHALSGGERQRIAIGRALLSQPRLLLMDEPLSGLDATRKAEILPFLIRLKTALSLPILYVTHALEEVTALADTLVLLRAGRVELAGPLQALTGQADGPLARRDDAGVVLMAEVVAHDPPRRLTRLRVGEMVLLVPLLELPPGTRLRARIPAREVILAAAAPDGISVHNILPGRVIQIAEDPARHAALVAVESGGVSLLARVTPDAVQRLGLVPGGAVLALVKSVAVDVLGT